MSQPARKLVRSTKNRMIAGVCAGLGDYFSVDATLIRLLFVFATIFGGPGLIAYLIFWIVVPQDVEGSSVGQSSSVIIDQSEE